MSQERIRVFISYTAEDGDCASHIAKVLGGHPRFEVVYDRTTPFSHGKITGVLAQQLKACNRLLLLYSANIFDHSYVYFEVGRFLCNSKSDNLIIPVSINGSELPNFLRDYRWVNLRYSNDSLPSLDDLIECLLGEGYASKPLDFTSLDEAYSSHKFS